MGVEAWWEGGERIALGDGFHYFVRVDGPADAPVMTLLHGFPTSSYDWQPVVERLGGAFRTVCVDFLGFGDSDKPVRHRYSLVHQADAVEALWAHLGVAGGVLVGHDYGLSVAQELLARRAPVERVVLLNGGALPELHRPARIQRLLASNVTGPSLGRLVTERTFTEGLSAVFSVKLSEAELREHWLAACHRDGHRRSHDLLRYLAERRQNARRWRAALTGTEVPLRLVWGPEDPISGAHMLDGLRRLLPGAEVVELEGIGHYPQLEAPDDVAAALG